MEVLLAHYNEKRSQYLKRLTFRAGTEWDAEDILQEAYTRALKYFNAFDGSNFDRWFATIMNNALKDHKNSEKGFATVQMEEEELEGTPCTLYPDRVNAEIDALIMGRSKEHQEILTLFFRHDLDAVAISQITDYPYHMTRKAINRFQNDLKDLYG